MVEKNITRKYIFTVEGETEKRYFDWLETTINNSNQAECNVSIKTVVEQRPLKYAKGSNHRATPIITHICDIESNSPVHQQKFKDILDQLKEAKKQKGIQYNLGYSNFTFELWMVLHKQTLNGALTHRSQYLSPINKVFDENFGNLDKYKHETNFKRCLSKLTIEDVKEAIMRSRYIMERKADDGQRLIQYKGFSYYSENPSLPIWEAVERILHECGIIKRDIN